MLAGQPEVGPPRAGLDEAARIFARNSQGKGGGNIVEEHDRPGANARRADVDVGAMGVFRPKPGKQAQNLVGHEVSVAGCRGRQELVLPAQGISARDGDIEAADAVVDEPLPKGEPAALYPGGRVVHVPAKRAFRGR